MSNLSQVTDPRFRRGRKGIILVDCWDDEAVEATAWVEVFSANSRLTSNAGVQEARSAVALIEKLCPLEDREEGESYQCLGDQVWMRPDCEEHEMHRYFSIAEEGTASEEYEWPYLPWREATSPDESGAVKFWVVRVVCAV